MTTVSREEMLDGMDAIQHLLCDSECGGRCEVCPLKVMQDARAFIAAKPADDGVREATIEECAKAVEEMDFPAPRKNHRYQYDVKYKMVEAIRALSTKAKP